MKRKRAEGIRGWWVGHPDTGGVFVRAETRNRARLLGADETGLDYIGVQALRVSVLDGTGPEGVVDWDDAKALGAVKVCPRCGEEWAKLDADAGRPMCAGCWETPPELFQLLDAEFHFTLDAAADERNHKCPLWLGPGSPLGWENALIVHWDVAGRPAVAYLNPPYGRKVGLWVAKAFEEAASANATVVCLLPARTDTTWWHRYVMRSSEVRFLEGRLRFVGAASSAPFPSVVVVFRCGQVPETPGFSTMRVPGRRPHQETTARAILVEVGRG